MEDPVATGTAIGAAIGAAIAALRSASTNRSVRRELVQCERRNVELQDRISAFETEFVALRRLLPGGDWHRILGLHEYPPQE